MSRFRLTPHNTAFGLDIGQETVKLAYIQKTAKNTCVLEAVGKISLPVGSIDHGAIKDGKEVSEAIKKLYEAQRPRATLPKFAVCSLPERESFIRIIQMPRMPRHELADAIQWEIEGHIPVSKDEIYFDWVLPELDAGNETSAGANKKEQDHIDVLVVATQRTVADSYAQLVRGGGFVPVAFEVESQAIARCLLSPEAAQEAVLILDLGATKSTFIISAGGMIRFTTIIPVPNELIVQAVTNTMKVRNEQAYQLIRQVGLDPKQHDGRVLDAAMPILSDLLDQIRKYIDYYESNVMSHVSPRSAMKIKRVFLTGGGANLKGLPTYLSSNLDIAVEVANPWTNLDAQASKQTVDLAFKDAIGFSTAFGLALRAAERSWM